MNARFELPTGPRNSTFAYAPDGAVLGSFTNEVGHFDDPADSLALRLLRSPRVIHPKIALDEKQKTK